MALFCLFGSRGEAGRDALFGDLPDAVRSIDQALMDVGATERFGNLIDALSSRIASESSVSGIAPGGFSYEIGPLGLPTKTSTSLGTIWTHGAHPLGSERLSLGVAYTDLRFDRFDGRRLDDFLDFSESSPPVDIDLELRTRILGLSALYGVSDAWEIGLFVPFVAHRSRGDIYLGNRWVGDADGDTEGLGDLMLLTKYRLAGDRDWAFSVAGRLKLPTGDEDRYLGTGETDVWIQALLTRRMGNLEANLDVGYIWSGLGRDYDSFNYRAGIAYGLTDRITVVGELAGSHSEESIFDTLDAGAGVKWNPAGGLVIQGGVRFPVDDNGLRAEWTPTVGVEWRF